MVVPARSQCAVIGDPAAHSLSPAIHCAGYAAHALAWQYQAFDVQPEELTGFVQQRLADPSWVGLSVTAPHKEAICAFGEPDHVAKLVGAGNTIVFGEQPKVYNTDVPGFVRAWRFHGNPTLKSAAIVGNGATARSLLVAMAGLQVRQVQILARNPDKAAKLVELGIALGIDTCVQPIDEPLLKLDLLASTVPAAATAPYARGWAKAASVLFDVVYHPWPTPIGQAAEQAEKLALSGLDLLAGQAVDQFFLFTGQKISFEDCRLAALTELQNRS